MLRAVLTLTGTAAGLAALLTFKSHPATIAAAQPAAPPATSGATSSPAPTSASKTHPAAGKSATPSKSQAAGNSQAAAARTVTGAVANTQYGPMQIQLTLTGQKITNVTVLQRTNDGSESDEIDSTAIPKLTSETLAAQSAQINAVSGASYTSMGYIQSLQSALDKAK
jgi:uncharacterized protein with FMN-binding domain